MFQDPFQPGAYVNTERALFEIVGREGDLLELENVLTGFHHTRPVRGMLRSSTMGGRSEFTLTKPAPAVPDQIEGD